MSHDELLIDSVKTAFVWERRHSSVGLEQLIVIQAEQVAQRFTALHIVADAR